VQFDKGVTAGSGRNKKENQSAAKVTAVKKKTTMVVNKGAIRTTLVKENEPRRLRSAKQENPQKKAASIITKKVTVSQSAPIKKQKAPAKPAPEKKQPSTPTKAQP